MQSASNALRHGSHSFTCKLHHARLVGISMTICKSREIYQILQQKNTYMKNKRVGYYPFLVCLQFMKHLLFIYGHKDNVRLR